MLTKNANIINKLLKVVVMSESKKIIRFPCCPKEKVVYSETGRGWISVKCPNCGKYVVFYIENNYAQIQGPIRGINNIEQKY